MKNAMTKLTQKAVREKLASLPDSRRPQAYLLSSEHYDVSPKGETKAEWVREAAGGFGYDPYLVLVNLGGYTGATVAVLAGHPDEALQKADEWVCTRYYDGDPDECERARGRGEGVVAVEHLMIPQANPPEGKPSGLVRGLVTAGLALVGLGGIVMGVRASRRPSN